MLYESYSRFPAISVSDGFSSKLESDVLIACGEGNIQSLIQFIDDKYYLFRSVLCISFLHRCVAIIFLTVLTFVRELYSSMKK